MQGSKPLNEDEVKGILENLPNKIYRTLFILGLKTGFRISELLSLTRNQLVQYGKIKNEVTVERKNMKGKNKSRTVVLHGDAKTALLEMGILESSLNDKIFPICRSQAHRVIKAAVTKAKVEGKVSTHSMRKSFAQKIYHALGRDLVKTQKALGHSSMNSTVSYLSFEQSDIDDAIKSI